MLRKTLLHGLIALIREHAAASCSSSKVYAVKTAYTFIQKSKDTAHIYSPSDLLTQVQNRATASANQSVSILPPDPSNIQVTADKMPGGASLAQAYISRRPGQASAATGHSRHFRWCDPEVIPRADCRHAATRRALQESLLDKIRFQHVLDGFSLFANSRRQVV